MKKGQVTVFIMGGIAVLILATIIFSVATQDLEENIQPPPELDALYENMRQCIDNDANYALNRIAWFGSLEGSPQNTITIGTDKVTLLTQTPELPNIEPYLKEQITSCLRQENIEDQGLQLLDQGEPSFIIDYTNEEVIILANYKLEFTDGNNNLEMEKYRVKLPIRYKKLLEVVDYILNNPQIERRPYLQSQPFNFNILETNSHIIFMIEDEESGLAGIPFKFLFATQK